MHADPSTRHEALVTERTTLIGVDLLALSEKIVNRIAKDTVDEFVLGRDAAVIHRTMFGFPDNVGAATDTTHRFAHPASTKGTVLLPMPVHQTDQGTTIIP